MSGASVADVEALEVRVALLEQDVRALTAERDALREEVRRRRGSQIRVRNGMWTENDPLWPDSVVLVGMNVDRDGRTGEIVPVVIPYDEFSGMVQGAVSRILDGQRRARKALETFSGETAFNAARTHLGLPERAKAGS